MSEQVKTALTAEEIADTLARGLKAYPEGGADLEEEHVKLACEEFSKETIREMWARAKAKRPKPTPKPAKTEAPQKLDAGLPASRSYFLNRLLKSQPKALPQPKAQPELAQGETQPQPQHRATTIDAVVAELGAVAEANQAAGIVHQHEDETETATVKPAPGAPTLRAPISPEAKRRALVKFNPIRNPYSLNGFENARIALQQMQFDCALDLFHNKPVIRGKHAWLGGDGFEDLDNVVLKLRQLILDEFGFDPKHGVFDALRARCIDRAFDPILDYLDNVEWDGKSRLDSWLIDYAAADDTALNRAFGRKVLIAAVRRARHPGCKFDYLLVLEGAQGIGKSTLVLILAGEDFYSDKPIIGCDTKEQQESIQGVWIYEIAELEGLSKVDLNWMKGFLARTHDKARPAFARAVAEGL